ncbi:hypothetical protein GQ600_4031 [Phytophthora cactorum]|nr:hypothetical protein GQ600_4031 [Phytophthora cactorum]
MHISQQMRLQAGQQNQAHFAALRRCWPLNGCFVSQLLYSWCFGCGQRRSRSSRPDVQALTAPDTSAGLVILRIAASFSARVPLRTTLLSDGDPSRREGGSSAPGEDGDRAAVDTLPRRWCSVGYR